MVSMTPLPSTSKAEKASFISPTTWVRSRVRVKVQLPREPPVVRLRLRLGVRVKVRVRVQLPRESPDAPVAR